MSTESKCPFPGDTPTNATAGPRGNRDWWPNQLNLAILRQHSSLSSPMGEAFDYAEEFKKLDLDGSWEGWVIENLLAVAPPATQAFFYRSSAGAEIDLVLDMPKRRRWAIEIKRSSAPAASRGLHIAADDLKANARFVVHAGNESFPLPQGVRATTLADLQQALVDIGPIG